MIGAAARGERWAVFDLDGTLSRHDTLLPFVLGYLWGHPWRLPRLLLVLPAALRFVFDRDRGQIKGSLLRFTLGGVERASLARWAEQFVAQLVPAGLYAQGLEALEAHRARGERLLLMSAAPDLYVLRIAQALGFDQAICTQVRWRGDGRLDGRLASCNCRGEEKRRQLAALIARERPAHLCAYGNSRADLPHMQLAQDAYLVNAVRRPVASSAGAQVQQVRWRG